jgi:hypothetical protein
MARKIEMTARKIDMKDHDQTAEDIVYWLAKAPSERLRAVTFLTAQSLPDTLHERKTQVIKEKATVFQLFEQLLGSLRAHQVEYLTVGGYAMAYHGMPRYTDDFDIWVKTSQRNMSLLSSALIALGSERIMDAILNDDPEANGLKFGVPPVAVHIQMNLYGLDFETAISNRELVDIDGMPVPFISKQHFIEYKLLSDRIQDNVDGKIIQTGRGR